MKKIGVLGGTFNPVHNGHLRLAFIMRERLGLDKVLLIPSLIPPHKDAPAGAKTEDRVNMLKLCCKEHPFLELEEFELARREKSYSYFTLQYLLEKDPDARYYFLTGSDMFLSLDSWYRYEDIMKMAVFCTVSRNEEDTELLLRKQKEYRRKGYETVVLESEPMELSSTDIRVMIENRNDVAEYLPEAVLEYIKENKLYGSL